MESTTGIVKELVRMIHKRKVQGSSNFTFRINISIDMSIEALIYTYIFENQRITNLKWLPYAKSKLRSIPNRPLREGRRREYKQTKNNIEIMSRGKYRIKIMRRKLVKNLRLE